MARRSGHDQNTKLSLFARPQCCSLDELEHFKADAAQVQSLTLIGRAFDDAALARLRGLHDLEELEARLSPLGGWGLMFLDQPKLRSLRLRLHGADEFSLREAPG